jgi:predicted regulator of Ras-like GTPase activity (Roadblock/LC7/MglB family)
MDAAAALAELAELSTQVEAAAILRDGAVEATVGNADLAGRVARAAEDVLAAAEAVRPGGPEIERIEIVVPNGGVFVVRSGARTVVAATVPEPTAGLVLYDLRTCLRRIVDPPAPKRRGKKVDADA